MSKRIEQYLSGLAARDAAEADQDFLARLYASTRTDLHGDGADPAFVASLIGMQQRLQARAYAAAYPAARYLVLSEHGQPVGRIVVDTGAAEVRLVDIALLPEARGRGLGTRVLRGLQGFAAAHELPLSLRVHSSNPAAARLYLALGFVVIAADAVSAQLRWPRD
jgi:ribosomal protein S18 acetylase RimI-like enzyme